MSTTPPWLQPPHPLDPARLRHKRGFECFNEVQRLIDDFASLHRTGTPQGGPPLAYSDPQTEEWVPLPIWTVPPLALVFEISEMVYNLKVSLDYATYAFFEKALSEARIKPAHPKQVDRLLGLERFVQFPIVDSPKKFLAWCDKNREWLGSEVTIFDQAQPYRRRHMRFLGDSFHNLDKHRGLQALTVDVDLSAATFRETDAQTTEHHVLMWEGLPIYGFETQEGFPANRPVAMYANGSVEVSLPGGLPVIPTLDVLQSDVGALIDALALAF